MSNYKFNPENLYEATNKGLDIIFLYCPEAKGCENGKKAFKLRPDERTASAYIVEMDNCFIVKDWGNKGFNPIELCRHFTGFSYIEALRHLYAAFNVGETDTFFRPNTEFKDTDKEIGWFEIIVADEYKNLDVVGRFLNEKTALEYDFKPVKEYSFVFVNKKTNCNTICRIQSTDNFPIFCYQEHDDWAKIYQSMDKKHKHSYVGKRPERHTFGLKRLQSVFDETIENFNLDIAAAKKAKKSILVDELTKKRDNYKIDMVIIASGGSDGLNVASIGYNVIWFNSEAEKMTFDLWSQLSKIAHKIYNLPDIDKAGIDYAYSMAETFWNMPTIWLPESIKKNDGKDFRDWLKKYASVDFKSIQFHFKNLIAGALRMKFFDGKPDKYGQVKNYKLRFEFLCYFLNIKGFFTYKIEQKNLDNTAAEIIIFVKIDGKIVTKVSPRIIREFTKQFLREKGQPIEVLELVSMSTMFNENNLIGLKQIDLDFKGFSEDSQYYFFENNIAEITPDGINLHPQNSKAIQKFVWEQAVKKHKILPEKPFFDIQINADGKPEIEILRNDCEYFNFLINTSRVYWRDELETPFADEGEKQKYHEANRFNIAGQFLTQEQIKTQKAHLLNKIYAIGYLTHRYKQDSFAKMIVATDDKVKDLEDEANGGTGKSLTFKGLDLLLSNRHWLDGKNRNFESDKHILQGLTKENEYIIIDDAHPYFDINHLYNWITGSVVVNPKNSSPYEIQFDDLGKIVFLTNYGVRNYTSSTRRRLFFVTTSDYYHAKSDGYFEERKVSDDFGDKDLFKNWSSSQMNRHYNFLLQCCHVYLKYRRFDFSVPSANVEVNNIKATIGDSFYSWADGYFTHDFIDTDNTIVDGNLNKMLTRREIYKNYCDSVGKSAKNPNSFKTAIKDYCKVKGYIFNPKDMCNSDGLIKRRGNKEAGEPSQVECFYIKNAAILVAHPTKTQTNDNEPPETDLPF